MTTPDAHPVSAVSDQVRDALATVAGIPRLLVALDFDGTLSPHVVDPMTARMLPAAREAVHALAELPETTVALVSGRSLVDLRIIAEHGDDSPIVLAASHGAEYWIPGEGAVEPAEDDAERGLRDLLRARAEEIVADYDGVWIEPKTFGFGVHTRNATDEVGEQAAAAVDAMVAGAAPDWRRRTGKKIVEYAFRQEGKDTAIANLRERLGADAVLFAGDDTTDEDALRSLQPQDLGIHVGDGPTAARVSVADIPAMAAALAELADQRRHAQE
ncbi:trehalose-phosphatase [Microbacterium sp. bgisy207]|jgi:trehalose 6-phosphate phosphatase|uniref:trehalose-phosphatase n=1 Tax=Microbacterium sp. bgisy207 TaxID=3413800 RepID=UPI003EB86F75